MMDDFREYEEMRAKGATPEQISARGRQLGLDEIALVRMLRKVCASSLADAKRIAGSSDVFQRAQKIEPGCIVFWEGRDSVNGFYLVQARVQDVIDGVAYLCDHRKFLFRREELEEVPVHSDVLHKMKVSHLERPLSERIAAAIEFWEQLASVNRKAV